MATTTEVLAAVGALKTVVESFPAIIDGLEARVTAAIAAGGISPEAQAELDQAFADAQAALATAQAAAADALDGVDEAA